MPTTAPAETSIESSPIPTAGPLPPRTSSPGGVVAPLLRSVEPWAQHARYDPGRRWYTKVGEHDGHKVWLLSWLPGQGTEPARPR